MVRVNTKQSNKRAAEELENAHKTRLAKGEAGLHDPSSIPTLKQFEERFLDSIRTRCKPRTVVFYADRMTALLKFPPLADARLDLIDGTLVEQFIQSHDEKKVARATINRGLATLRRALRLAHERKLIPSAPRIQLMPNERMRTFVLTPALEKKYLAAVPQPLHDIAVLIIETGLRLGEALALRWADVELKPARGKMFGYLQVREGKTKNAKRAVSLTGRVTAMLRARYRAASGTAFVFPGDNPDKPFVYSSIDHIHRKVRDNLGLSKGESKDFVIHSLRHTALTRLGDAGVNPFVIMKIAGHSSIAVSQRYVHPSEEAMEAAFAKLSPEGKSGHTVGTRSKPRRT